MCMYIYIHVCFIYIYYIYITSERERDRQTERLREAAIVCACTLGAMNFSWIVFHCLSVSFSVSLSQTFHPRMYTPQNVLQGHCRSCHVAILRMLQLTLGRGPTAMWRAAGVEPSW